MQKMTKLKIVSYFSLFQVTQTTESSHSMKAYQQIIKEDFKEKQYNKIKNKS